MLCLVSKVRNLCLGSGAKYEAENAIESLSCSTFHAALDDEDGAKRIMRASPFCIYWTNSSHTTGLETGVEMEGREFIRNVFGESSLPKGYRRNPQSRIDGPE